MKIPACLLAGLSGLFVPAAVFCAATVDVEKEKAAVIAVIEEEKNAYLALDDTRMAATWIQQPTSAKVYVFDGKETRFDGYAAIAAHDRENLLRERALPEAQRSRFAFADYHVTLQGDSAWATCHARWQGIWEGLPMSSTSARIFALQKEDGRWRLALMAISSLVSEPRDQTAATAAGQVNRLRQFGGLIVGRWTSEVVWAVDYPGIGKKGEKVIGFDTWRWSADGEALECEWMLGATSGRTLMWWDATSATIRTLNVDSGGNWAEGTITPRGDAWAWTCAGGFSDGRRVEYHSETSFIDDGQTRIDAGATILNGARNEYRDVFRRIRK